MSQQLAYVIITPYSLYKSRTGGILSRLISRTGLDLAAARMFAPSAELAKAICRNHRFGERPAGPENPGTAQAIRPAKSFARPQNRPAAARDDAFVPRRGGGAQRSARSSAISVPTAACGETIRDTYGDLIMDDDGQVRYFEPAVLAAPNAEEAETKLKLWARYSDSDGGVLENVIAYPARRDRPAHAGAHQAGQFPIPDRPARQRD